MMISAAVCRVSNFRPTVNFSVRTARGGERWRLFEVRFDLYENEEKTVI